MVTGLVIAVLVLGATLAILWWDLTNTKRGIESLWSRTREFHNRLGGLENNHASTRGELRRMKAFTLRIHKDIHR